MEQTSNKAKRGVAPASTTSESHEPKSDDVSLNAALPALNRVNREPHEGIPTDDWTEIVIDTLRHDGAVNAAASDSTSTTDRLPVTRNMSLPTTQGTLTTPALQISNETLSASTPRAISTNLTVGRPLIPTRRDVEAPTTLQRMPSPVSRPQLSMVSRPPSVRPARPTSNSRQVMLMMNMLSEQLRDIQRQNDELKMTMQATNKRQTNLEIAIEQRRRLTLL